MYNVEEIKNIINNLVYFPDARTRNGWEEVSILKRLINYYEELNDVEKLNTIEKIFDLCVKVNEYNEYDDDEKEYVFKGYELAVSMPAKVKNFLKEQYNEIQFQKDKRQEALEECINKLSR